MAIRWEKLTVKAQEAVQRGNELAAEHGNPELLPLHLLAALLEDKEGIILPVLEKIGIGATQQDTAALRTTLSSRDFDMIIFAWTDTPFPSGSDPIFQTKTRSTGAQNYDSYSNRTVDTLIGLAGIELDHARQASLYNQADAILWKDMVTLPLFQKPTLLVYQSRYKNLVNNITTEGPVSTMEQWGLPK